MRYSPRMWFVLLIAPSIISAACAGVASTPAPAPTSVPAAEPTLMPIPTPQATHSPTPIPTPKLDLPEFANGWTVEDIGRGIKPSLALDGSGIPHIAYMLENREGFVKYAHKALDRWDVNTVSEGYFYGPLDIAVGPDDTPHIVYHDHEDLIQFQPDKGDLVHASLVDGKWEVEKIFDVGHDGWDGAIAIGSDNLPRVSAIDPLDFEGRGVEFYEANANGSWTVEHTGSPPVTYKYSTSIVLDEQQNPYITYHSGREGLQLASRRNGEWAVETVDDEFRTGIFSSIAMDKSGDLHISYMRKSGERSGEVRYAFRAASDESWQITSIDTLDEILYGTGNGARNSVSLALDSGGNPWIIYSDESVIRLAVWNGSAWEKSVIATSKDTPFGQLVSLKLDPQDTPHLTYFMTTSRLPLDGEVMYSTRQP